MTIKLSVVIPCYEEHSKFLSALISELTQQTRLPDEVSIGHSQLNDIEAKHLSKTLSENSPFSIYIVNTEGYALAATNRNNGVSRISGDYIVFLDADDKYHPDLLRTIEYIISKYDPDAIMYSFGCEFSPIPEILPIIDSTQIFNHTWPTAERDYIAETQDYSWNPVLLTGVTHESNQGGCHGPLVVKTEIFREMPQLNIALREDSVYCRDILWRWHINGRKGAGFLFLNFPLTILKRTNSTI